jgi:sugar lactone lactonase YvrE
VATLADRLLVPEGIAYDPVARAFYVGSIARRSIHRVRRDGSLAPLSRRGDDLDEVLGIAIDARSRRLYAVSTNALTAQGRARLRNAVKAYDLEAGRLVATFDVPEARQLNDVAILPEALLVTDSAAGAVWRIALAGGGVSAVVPPGGANGANGVAVAPSGDAAYVAAARRPLHVDLASGKVTPLVPPGRENAAAIDGLVWHDGALIGVQNFTTPGRIVRLPLAADGRSLVAVETLRSHHGEALDEPTTAAIAPDGLHVLTTTSVTRYADDGRVLDPGTVRAPRILRIPLAPRAGAPASK